MFVYFFRPKFSRIKDKKQLADYMEKNDPLLDVSKFSFSVKDALELAGGDPDDKLEDQKPSVPDEKPEATASAGNN